LQNSTEEEKIKRKKILDYFESKAKADISSFFGDKVDFSNLIQSVLLQLYATPDDYLQIYNKTLEQVITEQLNSDKVSISSTL